MVPLGGLERWRLKAPGAEVGRGWKVPEGENVGVGVVEERVAEAGRPLPRETAIPVGVGVDDAAVEGPSPSWEPVG